MSEYVPSDDLIKAVLAAIAAPLPFVVGMAFKVVPYKEKLMSTALGIAIPMSLRAIAATQKEGARMRITSHGELTDEVKRGMIERIARWFVPNEVRDLTEALQSDVRRMARSVYTESGWNIEVEGDECVIVVTGTSFLKVSADTVADLFFDSVEALKVLRKKLPFVGAA
ncbi:MAG: hypothetical protein KBD06_00130 [Candidatus Pacebacteria bacterium]|nr:hypothetical protein [Candidatus Paceibacterota bacterium]